MVAVAGQSHFKTFNGEFYVMYFYRSFEFFSNDCVLV